MQREWFEKDYYAVLGVPSTASQKEITKAYRKLAREFKLGIEVLEQRVMEKLGMGALLGVGQGSEKESQILVMRWDGAKDKSAAPVAIVGHDPHLSALASLLVTGCAEPTNFVLKKCAVLRLDRTGNGWSVRWQISPEIVRD